MEMPQSGFLLDAFFGKFADLQAWCRELPSAVVCQLSGQLAMVPATSGLIADLSKRMKGDVFRAWCKAASHSAPIAYVSLGEWNGQCWESGIVCHLDEEVTSAANAQAILDQLASDCRITFRTQDFHLKRYRGAWAANSWASSVVVDRPLGATAINYFVQDRVGESHPAIYRVNRYIENSTVGPEHGYSWACSERKWIECEDVLRRYWSGFDADVDDVPEDYVISLIRSSA